MRQINSDKDDRLATAMRSSRKHPELFADVFRGTADPVLRDLTSMTRNAESAADLTAETFAVAFEKRGRFRGRSDAELLAWLRTIARNKFVDSLKKGRNELTAVEALAIEVPAISEDEAVALERLAATDEARSSLAHELNRLPRRQRDAVVMRVVDELSYDEIAGRSGTTSASSRQHVSRGLASLRGRLQDSNRG